MIFKKTLFALALIAIDVIANVSASGADAQKQLAKKKGSKKPIILQDMTGAVEAVRAEEEDTVMTVSPQRQPVPLINQQFEELIKQRKYKEIEKIGKSMKDEEFLKQFCPLIVSLAHYKGLYECLKRRGMVPDFFVHGKMEVVREIIAGMDYNIWHYIKDGDLEVAIPLALKEEQHDRAMNLLVARQAATAEEDEQTKQKGRKTSFGCFMCLFFNNLAPWKDSKSLKRFMTLRGETLNNEHPIIYETVCRELVYCLKDMLHDLYKRKLMVDLVAQPALLTLTPFAKEFLDYANDTRRSDFITYGWREAVQEGLKEEYPHGGKYLWSAVMKKYRGEFLPDYPPTADVLDAVLKKFKTKQQLEREWLVRNFPDFLDKVEKEVMVLVPIVLVEIIAEYARPTWLDVGIEYILRV